MRAISSSTDAHGVRYTEKIKRIQKIKRVNEVEKKEKITPVGYYEERGMTEEDKERKTSMTPQEAFRKEMAQRGNSKIYSKLQNKENNKEEKSKETKKEDQESER